MVPRADDASLRAEPDPGKQAMAAWRDGIRPLWTGATAKTVYALARRVAGLSPGAPPAGGAGGGGR